MRLQVIISIEIVMFFFCLMAGAEQYYHISPSGTQVVLPGQSAHFRAWSKFSNQRYDYTWYVNNQWTATGQDLELRPGFANNSEVKCYLSYRGSSGYTDTANVIVMSSPFAIQSSYEVQFRAAMAPNTVQYSKSLIWDAALSQDVILRLFPGQIWSVDLSQLVGGYQLQYHWKLNGIESPIDFRMAYIQATFSPALNGSTYQLTVSNPVGFILLPRLITILALPEPIGVPTDIYAVAGEEIRIQAEFHPDAVPSSLFWELNGEHINVNDSTFNIEASTNLDQALLTLVTANLAGESRATVIIHVQTQPWFFVAIGASTFVLFAIIALVVLFYKGILRFPKKENTPEAGFTPLPATTEAGGQSFHFDEDNSELVGVPLDDVDDVTTSGSEHDNTTA